MVRAERGHLRDIHARARRMWRELQVFVDHPSAGLLPNPMVAHPQPALTDEPVEEAELLENLGEFPGRTDQGDRMLTPMTKQKARDWLRRG